jgi:hypothetical protein
MRVSTKIYRKIFERRGHRLEIYYSENPEVNTTVIEFFLYEAGYFKTFTLDCLERPSKVMNFLTKFKFNKKYYIYYFFYYMLLNR